MNTKAFQQEHSQEREDVIQDAVHLFSAPLTLSVSTENRLLSQLLKEKESVQILIMLYV